MECKVTNHWHYLATPVKPSPLPSNPKSSRTFGQQRDLLSQKDFVQENVMNMFRVAHRPVLTCSREHNCSPLSCYWLIWRWSSSTETLKQTLRMMQPQPCICSQVWKPQLSHSKLSSCYCGQTTQTLFQLTINHLSTCIAYVIHLNINKVHLSKDNGVCIYIFRLYLKFKTCMALKKKSHTGSFKFWLLFCVAIPPKKKNCSNQLTETWN